MLTHAPYYSKNANYALVAASQILRFNALLNKIFGVFASTSLQHANIEQLVCLIYSNMCNVSSWSLPALDRYIFENVELFLETEKKETHTWSQL